MAYLVLARKWRPKTFEEVVGQAHVTRTLQNAIASGRVGHGYLFTGPRGVGKTTSARILAKALNCAKGPTPHPCGECPSCIEISGPGSVDVIEIDGASNNSVDDIRELRDKVAYGGVRDRHKVYIIDEVHMLSQAAFNALLKTLEEPPSHVVFILATTEVQKIPATILSRTQRFDFRRIPVREMAAHLKSILDAEGVGSTPEALALVARAGGGSLRDAQTLLDQVISYCGLGPDGLPAPVSAEAVLQVLGGVEEGQALAALQAAMEGRLGDAFIWVQGLYARGADLKVALGTLSDLLRSLFLARTLAPEALAASSDLMPETLQALSRLAKGLGPARAASLLKAAGEAESQLRFASNQRLVLEGFFMKAAPSAPTASLGELFDRLALMEERLKSPLASAAPAAAKAEPGPAPAPAPAAAPASAPVAAAAASASAAPAPGREAGSPEPLVQDLEEAPQAAKAAWGLEAVRAGWEKVADKASAASAVLGTSVRDVEISSLEGALLTLTVRNAFQRETLDDAGHRRVLREVLKACFGRELDLKVLLAAPKLAPKPAGRGQGPSEAEVREVLARDPAVARVRELFEAEIVDIRKTNP
jgi:DNA polymerase-3 subunit gamma/tau